MSLDLRVARRLRQPREGGCRGPGLGRASSPVWGLSRDGRSLLVTTVPTKQSLPYSGFYSKGARFAAAMAGSSHGRVDGFAGEAMRCTRARPGRAAAGAETQTGLSGRAAAPRRRGRPHGYEGGLKAQDASRQRLDESPVTDGDSVARSSDAARNPGGAVLKGTGSLTLPLTIGARTRYSDAYRSRRVTPGRRDPRC